MGKIHVIMDAHQNFHRVHYKVENGTFRELTYSGEDGICGFSKGDTITTVYHMLNLIEQEFKNFNPEDTVFSIVFDSRCDTRQEINEDYKSNRKGKMTDEGRSIIDSVRKILEYIGYNVYKVDDREADDIIKSLVDNTHSYYSHTYVYTNDADLLINLKKDVTVRRYRNTETKYLDYTPETFTALMEKEYGCQMPYNCIYLYKCLVGDKSDKIAGVKGYGPKAFDQLITSLKYKGFDFRLLVSANNVRKVLELEKEAICKGKDEKLEQALNSLAEVESQPVELTTLPIFNEDLARQHEERYTLLGLPSLAKKWKK